MTESEIRAGEIALYREGVLQAVARDEAAGLSQNQASKRWGVSSATVGRWKKLYASGGRDALMPRWENSGRKPLAELDDTEKRIAQTLYLQTGSTTLALRKLAAHPECREETANVILTRRRSKHTVTPTLRAQVTMSPDVLEFYRSPKQARFSFLNPRDLSYIDATGERRQLMPGDLFERDDMSNNFLVWVPWPQGGDPCSDRYGVRIARGQLLVCMDVASQHIVSWTFLIRLLDSYRADDIWQWVGRDYLNIGQPRIGERWERGTWQSKKLRGDDAPIAPGHTDEKIRVGGLGALGVRMIVSQSPTTKTIERRFNFLQSCMADIPFQIGRERGQMERETKVWTACRLGHRDPRDYALPHSAATQAIEGAAAFCNHEPVEGTVYSGIPAEVWAQGIAAAPLVTTDPDRLHLFARDRRTITASKAHLMVRYTSPEGDRSAWHFHHPDLRRYEGRKFDLYFDRYQPAAGGTLVHADGHQAGQRLGHAELVEGCPQFALNVPGSIVSDPDGIRRRKAAAAAVRAEYRATDAHGLRWAHRTSSHDDGAGHRQEVAHQTVTPDSAQPRATRAEAPADAPPARRRSTTPTRAARRDADDDSALVARLEREAQLHGDIYL